MVKLDKADRRSKAMRREWLADIEQRLWFAGDKYLRKVGAKKLGYKVGKVGERKVNEQFDRNAGKQFLTKYCGYDL